METYSKPNVIADEGLSEGVYMASGAGEPECWTIDAVSVQDWNGSHHVFEIRCVHSTAAVHISSATEVVLTFNTALIDAYSEFPCTFSGNMATVNRTLHANAYKSGDTMTYKVWVQADSEAATKALYVTNATITCTKTVNVQGGYDG